MSHPDIVFSGCRRELFIDDFMVASLAGGARRVLHHPQPREIVLIHDRPWEGNTSAYLTFLHDGPKVRVYYRGSQLNPRLVGEAGDHEVTCMAESDDGINFRKPNLGLVSFQGSTANNIVHDGIGRHNFAPFIDPRPDCPSEEHYKALGGTDGLFPFVSPDGIHWRQAAEKPVMIDGYFDSQNVAFWDAVRGEYRVYYRDWHVRDPSRTPQPSDLRDIKTATSPDFLNWTAGQWLDYPGSPVEQLYTNQVMPCPGAPHLLIGFPTRFLEERGQITEGLLMSSRDGVIFQRWGEALIRPGLNRQRWGNRSNYIWQGIIETASDLPGAPNEWSLYSTEGYYEGAMCQVRRFTVRRDGFVSVQAPLSGGELTTRPLTFGGSALSLNVSTAAAGEVRVEIQTPEGQPIEGFNAACCEAVWGDAVERKVTWKHQSDLGALAGRPVRVRFAMRDCDLYSFHFGE